MKRSENSDLKRIYALLKALKNLPSLKILSVELFPWTTFLKSALFVSQCIQTFSQALGELTLLEKIEIRLNV